MRRSRTLLAIALGTAVLVALGVVSCAQPGPVWVDSGASYTNKTVPAVLEKTDISEYENTPAADAPELRHQALVDLRKRDDNASSAADLITKTLPADSQGVPVHVEHASFGGQDAYLIVEAIGPADGKLTTKRLWVLSSAGAVLFVGTR